jgi:carbonic anhydrase
VTDAFFVVSNPRRSLHIRRMNTPSTILMLASALCLAVSSAQAVDAKHSSAPGNEAEAAFKKLQAGNARFVSQPESSAKATSKARKASAKSEHPFAVVVGCSDSRTAPEAVFDQNIGDLFVIRTPGNVVDDHALGGIEYAVNQLGAKLVVVLGVKRCSFVEAAVNGHVLPGHLPSVTREIQQAVRAVRHDEGDLLVNAVHENVYRAADKISKKAHFGDAASSVRIVRALYDTGTGKVEFLK